MQEKPNVRSILAVPRAIASAVSDWRRSGGGTRLTWRAGDSMAASLYDSRPVATGPKARNTPQMRAQGALIWTTGHREAGGTWVPRDGTHGGETMKQRFRYHGITLAFALATLPFTAGLSQAVAKPAVEVAFVLDTTGSMGGLIEGAKRKIWSIATAIVDSNPDAEVRIGLVAYRDIGDDYVTRTFDLTTDIQDLYANLLELK